MVKEVGVLTMIMLIGGIGRLEKKAKVANMVMNTFPRVSAAHIQSILIMHHGNDISTASTYNERILVMNIIAKRVQEIAAKSDFVASFLSQEICKAAGELFLQCKDIEPKYFASISHLSNAEVRALLLNHNFCNNVNVVWLGIYEGINVAYTKFVEYYDDLWFPSSDDVIVLGSDMTHILNLSHEEYITVKYIS